MISLIQNIFDSPSRVCQRVDGLSSKFLHVVPAIKETMMRQFKEEVDAVINE